MTDRTGPEDTFRILLSYHYLRGVADFGAELHRWFGHVGMPELFLDSGAFSAATQGAPIDVDDYGAWLQRNNRWAVTYANLDVIGDDASSAAATWDNQKRLEERFGLHPLPVVHAGEPPAALDRYLEAGYRYIGLGGLVGRPPRTFMPWLVDAFRRARGVAVFHGFGVTSWLPLRALPFFSVDSSSWGSGYRYGIIRLWDDRAGRMVIFGLPERFKHGALIRRYGFQPNDFDRDTVGANQCRRNLAAVSALSWRAAEAWLRRRHGRIALPDGSDVGAGLRWDNSDTDLSNLSHGADGLRLYVTDGSFDNLAAGADGLRLYLADTNIGDLSAGADGLRLYPTSRPLRELAEAKADLDEKERVT